jgi:hypothetical protein
LEHTANSASGHPAQEASRIGNLIRLLLGTDKDGEAVAALTVLKRVLTASGLIALDKIEGGGPTGGSGQ